MLEQRYQDEKRGSSDKKVKQRLAEQSLQRRDSAARRRRRSIHLQASTRNFGDLNRNIELVSDGMHFDTLQVRSHYTCRSGGSW